MLLIVTLPPSLSKVDELTCAQLFTNCSRA
jgi:hypothetical protein